MVDLQINNQESFTQKLYDLTENLNINKITFIQRLIYNKKKNYYIFYIPKKKGKRKIEAPSNSLKKIQRKILSNVLKEKWSCKYIHKSCNGFMPGKSIISNSKNHILKKKILKVDLKNFFPTIKSKEIKEIFLLKGFNDQCARYLTELCTLDGKLPQGAPTSPVLSNIVCRNLDKRLYYLSNKANINYTRYADDLTFSGGKISKKFYLLIDLIIRDEGFKINLNKVYWFNNSKCQKVTGLIVNDKISYGKKKFKNLSAFVFNCANESNNLYDQKIKAINKFGLKILNLKRFIEGHISFLYSIDKNKGLKLKDMFDSISQIRWDDYELQDKKEDKKEIFIDLCRLIREINSNFINHLFIGNFENLISFVSEINNKNDFNSFLMDFGLYIDKINTLDLGIKVNKENKPCDNLMIWFNEKKYDGEELVNVLRDIKQISNNFLRHENNEKTQKNFQRYGESINNVDYNRISIKLIKRLNYTLIQMNIIFKKEILYN